MVSREDLERWLRGEPPAAPPPGEFPTVRGMEIEPHKFLLLFNVEGVGPLAGQLWLEHDNVRFSVDLPWLIPEPCVEAWEALLRLNSRYLIARFVRNGSVASLVIDHPSGPPERAYFDYFGIVFFLGMAQEIIARAGQVLIPLIRRCLEGPF